MNKRIVIKSVCVGIPAGILTMLATSIVVSGESTQPSELQSMLSIMPYILGTGMAFAITNTAYKVFTRFDAQPKNISEQ